MQQDLPNLVDERRFRRTREPENVERDEYGRVKFSLPIVEFYYLCAAPTLLFSN